MANIINRQQTFATNGTVDAASLHNIIDTALVNSAIIKNQDEITTIGTSDLLLIAPSSVDASLAPRKVTVQNLFDDGLTSGTFTSLNLSGALTYGTATGNSTVSTSATITTGTITNLTSSTSNITLGIIPTLTAGTTTSTAATITNLASTTGTIATLNSTTGTIATLNSTTGTIATLKSTTGTITNLSTTLAGDFTISSGTGTLGTSGATAGTYGSVTAIPFLTVDAKGRITSATTGTFSSTPADGSITLAKLSTSSTEADNVAKRTAKVWVNFIGTSGSVSIRSDFNVSTVAETNSGDYTINFSSNLADSDYATVVSAARHDASNDAEVKTSIGFTGTVYSTSAVRVQMNSGGARTTPRMCLIVLGN
jgi:hypothetical protein